MGWLLLLIAILFEVSGTIAMKLSNGFTRIIPAFYMFGCYILSFTILTFALKRLEVGVAYAVWSGIGTALIGTIGMVVFHESVNPLKIISILVIILGVVCLNISSTMH
ncbi:multidrug efflux SMR transporter [Fodinisporobacter ferrooxydans]|uniref:Multidrug efflux SMR transporter n=1 Tax=Fodinisporobacter ferrooxydans TaxID=2901836 RepID=A0ABY4CQD1_9BACL|nr:multidrug efflux SMR transporter [Alicyclobacillaceae bacterium MYW30-H2]